MPTDYTIPWGTPNVGHKFRLPTDTDPADVHQAFKDFVDAFPPLPQTFGTWAIGKVITVDANAGGFYWADGTILIGSQPPPADPGKLLVQFRGLLAEGGASSTLVNEMVASAHESLNGLNDDFTVPTFNWGPGGLTSWSASSEFTAKTVPVSKAVYDFLNSGKYSTSKHMVSYKELNFDGATYSIKWYLPVSTSRKNDLRAWNPAGPHQRTKDLTIGHGLTWDPSTSTISLDPDIEARLAALESRP